MSHPSAPSPVLRHRRSWWRVAVGALWVVVAVVCAARSGAALLGGHPAYPVTLGAVATIGAILVLTGLSSVTADRPRHPLATVVGRFLGGLGTVLLIGSVVYLVPSSAAADAIAAMAGTAAVRVETSPTRIVLTPTAGSPRAGLVFQPGAKVDPRAYVPMLTQVAAAGYQVTVVKQPYAIGFLAIGEPGNVIAATPGVTRWAVGGHSLGGVAASVYAAPPDSHVQGLLFWASYPLGSLADRTDLTVASVSGSNDGLSTPSDIAASRATLPPSTVFTTVPGAVHAFFGDYGPQSGDGRPTVDRATAQRQIIQASTDFMAAVAAG